MALSGSGLSAAIKAGILGAGIGAVDDANLQGLCDALGDSIVDHITANLDVTFPAVSCAVIGAPPNTPISGGPNPAPITCGVA